MIVRFSVENFRSIKDKQTLSFISSNADDTLIDHVTVVDKERKVSIVKSIGIFGGNASGKSNLLKALFALRSHVIKSYDYTLDEPLPDYFPNKLLIDGNKTIHLEVEFIAKDSGRYIYSIEYDNKIFLEESLYKYVGDSVQKKAKIFSRDTSGITFGTYYKGFKKFNLFPNQLVLSQANKKFLGLEFSFLQQLQPVEQLLLMN
jgi:AAA15 family ATPase/GTPase